MMTWVRRHTTLKKFPYLCSIKHYNDVIISVMMPQITGVSIVFSTVCSGTDQRKHQSSASLDFCEGNSSVTDRFPSQKAIVTRKRFPFDDVLTLIPARISNYIHFKMWDEITYQFRNFNCASVEVWKWISIFITYLNGRMIISKLRLKLINRGAPGDPNKHTWTI